MPRQGKTMTRQWQDNDQDNDKTMTRQDKTMTRQCQDKARQ